MLFAAAVVAAALAAVVAAALAVVAAAVAAAGDWLWAAADSVNCFEPSGLPLLSPPLRPPTAAAAAAADPQEEQQQPRQLCPSLLQQKETRPPLYFSPAAVLQQMTLEPESFVQLLHANYLPFFQEIEDAAAAAAAFACADAAAAAFPAAIRRQKRHGEGDIPEATDGSLAFAAAHFCSRAVVDANLHPCCPSRSSSSSSSSSSGSSNSSSGKTWGYCFSGSITADVKKRQQDAAAAWCSYTWSLRSLLQQKLQQQQHLQAATGAITPAAAAAAAAAARIFWGSCIDTSASVFASQVLPSLRLMLTVGGPQGRLGGPYFLKKGPLNLKEGPYGMGCIGLCCFTDECCRMLLQWGAPLLQLLSSREGEALHKRRWGASDDTEEGPPNGISTLGPPPIDVPCSRCCMMARAPTFCWRGGGPPGPHSQWETPAGGPSGQPLGAAAQEIDDIEED